jgi:IS5 family transposase
MMERGTLVVNWGIIQTLLRAYYPVGQSPEGASAYYPMMLLKILLLQEWFHIPSDGELENLINDRITHKKCLGFSFDMLAPDHALFFRFRSSYVTIH